jgi:hypothetical protein
MDQYNHKIIEESVRGGPAYYRPSHHASDPHAKHRAQDREDREARQVRRGRVLCVKLPWVFAIIKLPVWSPIGRLLE